LPRSTTGLPPWSTSSLGGETTRGGRDKQAQDENDRQRKRELAAALERGDEPEPPVEPVAVEGVVAEVETLSFPASGADVLGAVGDRDLDADGRRFSIESLVPDTDVPRFDGPDSVRDHLRRPTVAAALKRVLEASDTPNGGKFEGSQYEAYERTFQELRAVDADDEGTRVITDCILDRLEDKGSLPGSRDVRREAANYCRSNGYSVRTDEWLGV